MGGDDLGRVGVEQRERGVASKPLEEEWEHDDNIYLTDPDKLRRCHDIILCGEKKEQEKAEK